MTKNLRTLLGDVHRYTGEYGITSEEMVDVFLWSDTARVELTLTGMRRLIRKLRLRPGAKEIVVDRSSVKSEHQTVAVIRGGIRWVVTCENNATVFASLFGGEAKPKPKARTTFERRKTWSETYGTSAREPEQARPQPSSQPPSWTIPRTSIEARRLVTNFYKIQAPMTDRQLLDFAKRGQIQFHPDRPSGDAHLSRVFNATARLLKGGC